MANRGARHCLSAAAAAADVVAAPRQPSCEDSKSISAGLRLHCRRAELAAAASAALLVLRCSSCCSRGRREAARAPISCIRRGPSTPGPKVCCSSSRTLQSRRGGNFCCLLLLLVLLLPRELHTESTKAATTPASCKRRFKSSSPVSSSSKPEAPTDLLLLGAPSNEICCRAEIHRCRNCSSCKQTIDKQKQQ